jgi:hypothetical protein
MGTEELIVRIKLGSIIDAKEIAPPERIEMRVSPYNEY